MNGNKRVDACRDPHSGVAFSPASALNRKPKGYQEAVSPVQQPGGQSKMLSDCKPFELALRRIGEVGPRLLLKHSKYRLFILYAIRRAFTFTSGGWLLQTSC